jgi:hypothetical protein
MNRIKTKSQITERVCFVIQFDSVPCSYPAHPVHPCLNILGFDLAGGAEIRKA